MQLNSRLERQEKQRKVNKIYNIAIIIVCLLIVIVSIIIFSGRQEDQTTTDKPKQSVQQKVSQKGSSYPSTGTSSNQSSDTTSNPSTNAQATMQESNQTKPELVKEQGNGDQNVLNTYTSNDWKPVGTNQTGTHTTSFEKDSTDWKEMTKALAYGTGLDEGSMQLWWLGNGGTPNTAVGTVSDGNNSKNYRVYIEWVDGEGWKPVKVEELKTNDKK